MRKEKNAWIAWIVSLLMLVGLMGVEWSIQTEAASGNAKGDIAKEYLLQRIQLPGVTYSSFGTVRAENLYHLGLQGSDGATVSVFCLDAPKNFTTGSTVRCIGSLEENASLYTALEREKLKGLMYFYRYNTVFKDSSLRQMLTQLGVWYVRNHPDNPDFNSSVFLRDVTSILQDPNVCYNAEQAVRWYREMTGETLEVSLYSSAYSRIAQLLAQELDQAVAAGSSMKTYVWSTGKSAYQNLLTTEPVTRWADLGSIEVYKVNEAGEALAGAVFTAVNTSTGTSYTIGPTDASGYAICHTIPSGTYTVTETTFPEGYMAGEETTWRLTVSFEETSRIGSASGVVNAAKQWRLCVTKKDSFSGGSSVAEASVGGAVYGLYNAAGDLLAEYQTDETGCFTTDYFPTGSGYSLKELVSAPGYRLDTASYALDDYTMPDASAAMYTEAELTLSEEVQVGRVSLTKSAVLLDGQKVPEAGAAFRIYWKGLGSYEAAVASGDHRLYDSAVVNESGIAIWSDGESTSRELAYGTYILEQTVSWDGYRAALPIEVEIYEDGHSYDYSLEDEVYKTILRIEKRDAESGELILSAAAFRILDQDTGEYVTYASPDGAGEVVSQFYTSGGVLTLPVALGSGRYQIEEVQVPEGYRSDGQTWLLEVNGETPELTELVITNDPLKGQLLLEKYGLQFTGIQNIETDYGLLYQPIFEEKYLADCLFEIRAAEDIVDGTGKLLFSKGEFVESLTTSAEGATLSGELPLGRYLVTEIAAPVGYLVSEEAIAVTLSNDGTKRVAIQSCRLVDERTCVCLSLQKKVWDWEIQQAGEYGVRSLIELPGEGVVFGVYTAEAIPTETGEALLEEDRLVAYMVTNEEGVAKVSLELPFGRYYVKELQTASERYLISEEHYAFTAEAQWNAEAVLNIALNEGEPIVNDFERRSLRIQKIDAATGAPLSGAVLCLSDAEGTFLYRLTTDTEGLSEEILLEKGEYRLWEETAPEGYTLSGEVLSFIIGEDAEEEMTIVTTIVMTNQPTVETGDSFDGWRWCLWMLISLPTGLTIFWIYQKKLRG